MNKRLPEKLYLRGILAALLLMLVLGACFLSACLVIDHFATDSCYNTMEDATRIIYATRYFAPMLERASGCFLPAIAEYAVDHVHEDDRPSFWSFFDYGFIGAEISTGRNLEYKYREPDGAVFTVRVLPADDYGPGGRNTFWIFEQFGHHSK